MDIIRYGGMTGNTLHSLDYLKLTGIQKLDRSQSSRGIGEPALQRRK